MRERRARVGGGALVLAAGIIGATLATAAARMLEGHLLVAVVVAGGIAAGTVAALAVPAKAIATPKSITDPPARLELERRALGRWLTAAILLGIVVVALAVRLWNFNDVGYNSDEAVYAGQGAGIAHDPSSPRTSRSSGRTRCSSRSVIAIGYEFDLGDWFGRAAAIGFGALCVLAAFELGRLLYGVRVGLLAAAVLALMPYHVIVSRQILLDGPQTFFTTVTLCLLIRYARSGRALWLCGAGAGMGLSVLAKEPSVIFCGAVYAFFALSPEIRVRFWTALISLVVMVITIVPYPLAVVLRGQTSTGGNFLAWQLVRRPNHSLSFYPPRCRARSGSASARSQR